MKFSFGPLRIDAAEYASHGNAVLGIRGSGKTYTATGLAERLFDAGIPFFAFDPIGVWRYLRVPGKGKGYPVVVAGGQAADLPLTVEGTPELVRAAMAAGVSLIFDFFDVHLSKADWRRIVTAAVRTMLHENQPHGLRHVFIEEAAEFIPQKVLDGIVYAEIEKLARMGGNARLGYTLINQRSQEVSKAILELCENVFLHRQRGKNALENMDKWLQVSDATERKKIMASLPELPQGQCWAWLGGDEPQPPTLVKVPAKSSLHPDRRVMRDDAMATPAAPVDVGDFIARMQGKLVKAGQDAAATSRRTPAAPKPKETEVTKEEAARLLAENDDLRLQISRLQAGRPAAPSDVPSPAPAVSLDATFDNEKLYQAIKDRLSKEAPGILKLLTVKPELEVKVERRTVEIDGTSIKGRIARLLAQGFYDQGVTNSGTRTELKRTGSDVNSANIGRVLDELKVWGFLTTDGSNNYRAVEGMKVNVVGG